MKVRITPGEDAGDRPNSENLQLFENAELHAKRLGKSNAELSDWSQTGFQFGTVAGSSEAGNRKTHAPESAWVSKSLVRAETGR